MLLNKIRLPPQPAKPFDQCIRPLTDSILSDAKNLLAAAKMELEGQVEENGRSKPASGYGSFRLHRAAWQNFDLSYLSIILSR
jgi:hypothetical protein